MPTGATRDDPPAVGADAFRVFLRGHAITSAVQVGGEVEQPRPRRPARLPVLGVAEAFHAARGLASRVEQDPQEEAPAVRAGALRHGPPPLRLVDVGDAAGEVGEAFQDAGGEGLTVLVEAAGQADDGFEGLEEVAFGAAAAAAGVPGDGEADAASRRGTASQMTMSAANAAGLPGSGASAGRGAMPARRRAADGSATSALERGPGTRPARWRCRVRGPPVLSLLTCPQLTVRGNCLESWYGREAG